VVRPGEALIVATGWGRKWNKPGYVLECPNFTKGAIAWILKRRVSLCAFDVPCIESSWSEDVTEEKGGLLGMLFRKNVLLGAPLVNVEKVRSDKGTLFCLPLLIAGTSGSPARVVFEERV
jgi:kynurenine formamidase